MSPRQEITVDRELIKDAAAWLGKMIADGAHNRAVMPGHCESTLQKLEAALRQDARP